MKIRADQICDLSLMDIMDRWPTTIPVFIAHQMFCVGCTIAPFHTIHDACREHNLDEEVITDELVCAITET